MCCNCLHNEISNRRKKIREIKLNFNKSIIVRYFNNRKKQSSQIPTVKIVIIYYYFF